MRIEETGVDVDKIEAAIRAIIPPESIALDRRQYRPADQRHQHGLFQYRIHRRLGCGHPHHPERRSGGRGPGLREGAARTAAAPVSGHDLRLPARRHRDPNSQLRACPRRSTCRSSARRSRPTAPMPTRCWPKSPASRESPTRAFSRPSTAPTLKSTSIEPGRSSSASANATSPRTCRTLWPAASRPRRRSGSIQRMEFRTRSSPRRRNIGSTRSRSSRIFRRLPGVATSRFSAASPRSNAASSDAVVSHYDVQPVIDIYATNKDRDLGAVAGDIQNASWRRPQGRAARLDVVLRGPSSDDEQRLSASFSSASRSRSC